jgi:hypothetical protein
VRVVIAAQAALLMLGLSLEQYRGVSGIIVHPTTLRTRGERPGPSAGTVSADRLAVVGLAKSGRGPVVLAWDQALAGAHRSQPGENVVLHEFAHTLDMLDGVIDGTPVLDRTGARTRRNARSPIGVQERMRNPSRQVGQPVSGQYGWRPLCRRSHVIRLAELDKRAAPGGLDRSHRLPGRRRFLCLRQ